MMSKHIFTYASIFLIVLVDTVDSRALIDERTKFERGDLRLLRAVTTGNHKMALESFTDLAYCNAMMTPEIGENNLQLGRPNIDFLVAPALHVAMTGTTVQHAEVAYLLVHRSADTMLSSLDFAQPQHHFAPPIMYTIGYGVYPNSTRAALLQKVITGFPQGFNMTRMNMWVQETKSPPPLHCAVLSRFFDGVYVLVTFKQSLPAFRYDPNEVNSDNQTALMVASIVGDIDIVKLLIHNKVKIMLADRFGRTCLHYAAMLGHVDVIKAILDAPSIKDPIYQRNLIQFSDLDGRNALGLAGITPPRMDAVNCLRSRMTPLGILPTTLVWRLKPVISNYRNISSIMSEYASFESLVPDDNHSVAVVNDTIRVAEVLAALNNSDIDNIFRKLPWSEETKKWFSRDYISPRRPVSISSVNETDESNTNKVENLFRFHDNEAIETILKWFGSSRLTPSLPDNQTRLKSNSLFLQNNNIVSLYGAIRLLYMQRIYKNTERMARQLKEVGQEDCGPNGQILLQETDNPVSSYFEGFFPLSTENQIMLALEMNEVAAVLNNIFDSKWCKPPTYNKSNVIVSVGSRGGLINGTNTFESVHLYNALISGIKHWFIFPPSNETAKTHRIQVLRKILTKSKRFSDIIKSLQDLKVSGKVAIYEALQYKGDVIYIPPRWSFLTINLVDSVSFLFQNCALDQHRHSCEYHSIRTSSLKTEEGIDNNH